LYADEILKKIITLYYDRWRQLLRVDDFSISVWKL